MKIFFVVDDDNEEDDEDEEDDDDGKHHSDAGSFLRLNQLTGRGFSGQHWTELSQYTDIQNVDVEFYFVKVKTVKSVKPATLKGKCLMFLNSLKLCVQKDAILCKHFMIECTTMVITDAGLEAFLFFQSARKTQNGIIDVCFIQMYSRQFLSMLF